MADNEIQVVRPIAFRVYKSERIDCGVEVFEMTDDEVQVVHSIAFRD